MDRDTLPRGKPGTCKKAADNSHRAAGRLLYIGWYSPGLNLDGHKLLKREKKGPPCLPYIRGWKTSAMLSHLHLSALPYSHTSIPCYTIINPLTRTASPATSGVRDTILNVLFDTPSIFNV